MSGNTQDLGEASEAEDALVVELRKLIEYLEETVDGPSVLAVKQLGEVCESVENRHGAPEWADLCDLYEGVKNGTGCLDRDLAIAAANKALAAREADAR